MDPHAEHRFDPDSLRIRASPPGELSPRRQPPRHRVGEAFLKDSVPTTTSLEAAFKKAADLVQHREAAEHLEHSNPQLYIGPAIRQKLMRLENGVSHKHEDAVIVRR